MPEHGRGWLDKLFNILYFIFEFFGYTGNGMDPSKQCSCLQEPTFRTHFTSTKCQYQHVMLDKLTPALIDRYGCVDCGPFMGTRKDCVVMVKTCL